MVSTKIPNIPWHLIIVLLHNNYICNMTTYIPPFLRSTGSGPRYPCSSSQMVTEIWPRPGANQLCVIGRGASVKCALAPIYVPPFPSGWGPAASHSSPMFFFFLGVVLNCQCTILKSQWHVSKLWHWLRFLLLITMNSYSYYYLLE